MDNESEMNRNDENTETDAGEQQNEAPTMGSINAMEVQRLQKELNEMRDKYLRTLAEMENARKRSIKERQDSNQAAVADVIIEFLKPLDNMENALSHTDKMSKDVQNWAIGFQMILTQFKDALASNGIVAIASKGQPFDPHVHEAIEVLETEDHPHGTVIEEFSKGYQMGTKTIRPARVKVSQELRTVGDEPVDVENLNQPNEE